MRIVKLLVDHGADVDTKRGDGSTPLYIACQENRLEVVNFLLQRGANVEATFKTGIMVVDVFFWACVRVVCMYVCACCMHRMWLRFCICCDFVFFLSFRKYHDIYDNFV